MSIVVEDGTQVTGANSYVTVANIETYADQRGITLTMDPEVLAIRSMDYIEAQRFIGTKVSSTQALQWPRTGVYIDGFEVPTTMIPVEVKYGQLATAMAIDAGNDPLASVQRGVKMQQVGDLKVEYDESGNVTLNRAINAALGKVLAGSGGGISSFSVERA